MQNLNIIAQIRSKMPQRSQKPWAQHLLFSVINRPQFTNLAAKILEQPSHSKIRNRFSLSLLCSFVLSGLQRPSPLACTMGHTAYLHTECCTSGESMAALHMNLFLARTHLHQARGWTGWKQFFN